MSELESFNFDGAGENKGVDELKGWPSSGNFHSVRDALNAQPASSKLQSTPEALVAVDAEPADRSAAAAAEPAKSFNRHTVLFTTPMGKLKAHFHQVVSREEIVVLRFDTEDGSAVQFIPTEKMALKISCDSAGLDDVAVINLGVMFNMLGNDFNVLHKLPPEAAQQPDAVTTGYDEHETVADDAFIDSHFIE